MKKSETKKAIALLGSRVERSELAGIDEDGLVLTIHWVGGGQKMFWSLEEVQHWLADRNHGGHREGAGSKPKLGVAKEPFSGRATPDVVEYLRSTGNLSLSIETLVRRSKAFRDWIKSRK